MRALVILAWINVISGVPSSENNRVVGGSEVDISKYPQNVALLHSRTLVTYYQSCGGAIINTRTVLTAAHCLSGWPTVAFRVRVGSSFANSGGQVSTLNFFIIHPNYNPFNHDSDLAIIQTSSTINYIENVVQAAVLADTNYRIVDNQAVWAAGWGSTSIDKNKSPQFASDSKDKPISKMIRLHRYLQYGALPSNELRHVQMTTVSQIICRHNYSARNRNITDNMICAGNIMTGGGRDLCVGDEGAPILHNGTVVGICSWIGDCGLTQYPSVSTRITEFATWIQGHS